ncbi:MAG: c-type cytochrome [Anaerolineae bacterium]|nr:c-type cytochrome [Anaerolineae bacterium]
MNKNGMRWLWIAVVLLLTMLFGVACKATPEQAVVEPTATPTAEPTLSLSTPTESSSQPTIPDPAVGQQLWQGKPCSGCHGADAEGSIGPKLAGTALDLDQVLLRVREGKGSMPAFTGEQVSDIEVQHIYAWLRSLAPPTPTQEPPTPTATEAVAATPTAADATKPAETPTAAPTSTPTTVPTSTPVPTETPSLPAAPDPATGQQVWQQKPCQNCHGASAQGDIGPKLAGTGLGFDQVLLRVRTGASSMPAFTEDQITDLELQHIYAWLRSLAPPTPTPVAAPSFPTGALLAMWQHVNDMKVASDFAKDLPERQAGDDAGRLGILKQHATTAVAQGQAAIDQANQALNDIPNENAKAVIRRVIDQVNVVVNQANQALGKNSFGEAWPLAAQMVYTSRLDAWPLATQAVRDAGLVGIVRVRVTNQAGSPIAGAFVTVLTAHTPVGVRTNDAGWATIANVAAVPALQVKAYDAGLIYHEVHVNLFPGAMADAGIVIPGASVGDQTPTVSNAAIEPSSGPGNAAVTFRVTATDPQGMPNLAEDQIFALNPDLRVAYIMRHVGGNQYAVQVTLPNLASGLHTWTFFAVDHQCNTSNMLTVQYRVQ